MKKVYPIIIFIIIFQILFSLDHAGFITTSETWSAADNPHIITGNLTIRGPGDGSISVVTLEPDVEVKFDGNFQIIVGNNNASYPGGLRSIGTGTSPVLFTSNQTIPTSGDWDYIRFYDYANDDTCHFEYTTFEYGGSSNPMIYVESASPIFENCSFLNMNQQAISHHNSSSGVIIANCSFENGNTYPITYYSNQAYNIGSGNTFFNNSIQTIQIINGTVSETQTWTYQPIPYYISNSHLNIFGSGDISSILTIEAGTILEFDTSKEIVVGHNYWTDQIGGIIADNVIFRGVTDSTGSWFGIRSRQFVKEDSVNFTNCTFQNGEYGLYAENETRFQVNNCTFTGNDKAASVLANEMHCFGSGNYYADNTDNRIELRADTIDDTQIWTTQNTSLYVTGNLQVSKAVILQ